MILLPEALEKANNRLKNGGTGFKLEHRGQRLTIRGRFPPRPRSGKNEPYTQRISLGIFANLAGVDYLEAKAREWSALMAQQRWDWSLVNDDDGDDGILVSVAIAQFEEDYFLRRERNNQTLTTWSCDYALPFKRLDQDVVLSIPVVMNAIAKTKPDTKARKRACIAYGALCKFYKIDIDLSRYSGTYSSLRVQPRDLPTDSEILDAYNLIPNIAWQFIYGLMAVYGVRNHECFRLDFSKMPVLIVLEETKTGYREVYPIYPEWVELFKLNDPILPKVNLMLPNNRLGTKVSHQFARYKIPFAPYNLRHAWAIRAISYGVPDSIAAAQMGHSLTVHNRTYQRWLTAANHKQVFEALMLKSVNSQPLDSSILVLK